MLGDSKTGSRPGIAGLPTRPNILLLITDQERYPTHWPAGWPSTNLPQWKRLQDHGLTFRRAYCVASMCSPSRASLFTGLYPKTHGVERTLSEGGSEPGLQPTVQTMGHMLASAGYNVVYKGKWHLSRGDGVDDPSASQVAGYGFNNWEPPDAGEGTGIDGFGGGCSNNDGRFVTQAVNFLGTQTPEGTATNPFALIVSLVNPHDVLAYPKTWDSDTCSGQGYADQGSSMFAQGIDLADTVSYSADDLSTKPTCQKESLTLMAAALGIVNSTLERHNYINFYAYLHKVVDDRMRQVLEALDANHLTDSTVIIRLSDHGEMGLAHGGLRQKIFNAYQETMHIPLVISHPNLAPMTTDCFASLVDLMPTLATLCGVPHPERFTFTGTDLTPLLTNPNAEVQSAILFTFDDQNAGVNFNQTTVKQPNHIRCVRLKDADGEWMYARYFDPSGQEPDQYEMYRLKDGPGTEVDPNELDNLAGNSSWDSKRATLAQALAALEKAKLIPYRNYLPALLK